MEVNDDNLRTLSNYLIQTLDPNPAVRRPAERFLESVELNRNYPVLLLRLIDSKEVDPTVRMAGSVVLKNYIKRNWPTEEDAQDKIDGNDRETVKKVIVQSMVVAPPSIQKQLSDAIYTIGKSDFPIKWPDLVPNMVSQFSTGDFNVISGVLTTAHSIFKRYRYEFKSQSLWEEIKFVLDTFADPLTKLMSVLMKAFSTVDDAAVLNIASCLLLVNKIFYSLNFQDLPEYFEDNAQTWMECFQVLLRLQDKRLESDSDSEPGLIESVKTQVCDNISLYAQKYDEEFRPFLPGFVTDIWNLLINTSSQVKNDILVSKALKFLSTVAERDMYKNLFEEASVLSDILTKVIIPNLQFREEDLELFEDNPDEYIRREVEGLDSETRRRSACDLVKVLAGHFGEQVSSVFSQFVQVALNDYRTDQGRWMQLDLALYIVTCLAERGSTTKHGITKTCDLVPIPEFAAANVFPELAKEVNLHPVIKADCIKYIIKFRSILPKEMLLGVLPDLIRHLSAVNPVVHSFAACAIEKLLIIRQNNELILTEQVLAPLSGDLLKGLFGVLTSKSEENDYAMKAIMRSFATLQDSLLPFLSELLPVLTLKLRVVAKNPIKPHFNHFLFETISISIKVVCQKNSSAVSLFEEALFPTFEVILREDIQEFVPYIMQVLSMMLEIHNEIPGPYLGLYSCLLAPALWERPGNVKGLVRLFKSYIRKSTPALYESHLKLPGILGVFQKLISTRANDHEGFFLLQCLFTYCPRNLLEPFIKQIFVLLFQRLMSSKTTKFVCCLLVFFCFYTLRFSSTEFIDLVDSIQPRMFEMILEKLFVPYAQKITGKTERRTAALGMGKMLVENKRLREGDYSQQWQQLLKVLTDLMENPVDETVSVEDHYVDVEDFQGYEATHNELVFIGQVKEDPLKGMVDPNLYLQLGGSLTTNQMEILKNCFAHS
ncbi:exportin-2 [Cimex lectularius]|uniref:Exportin-2 n=1 Tax=Cimex lectularius TaxID=79782 RepID=A0A8I6SA17_CIMLE|nr:exportin-2 [Cimex lectularius]